MENANLQQNLLGKILNIPKEILSKINISNTFMLESQNQPIEFVIISGDSVDNISAFVNNLGGKYEDLGYGFGLATIPISKLVDLALNTKIQYIEIPKSLYLTDSQSNRYICVPETQSSYNIKGNGVLVGFIDTGIDYTHPAFRNDDGTTRIEYIYDLSADGAVYNKARIDEALQSTSPFQIVPSNDVAGHGTHVVGIACAGGRIDSRYYGVAPNSSIAMVKVTRTQFALSSLVMRGLRFLIERSKELNMPLVVNMSLSTNDGAHNGSSLLEQYIQTVATLERVTIVIAAGNEGDTAHHVGREINDVNEVFFNVAGDEAIVSVSLYKSILPELSIELTNPSGISTGEMAILEGFKNGVIGTSRYVIYDTGPKPFDISGEIGIVLTGSQYVSAGQWKITLRRKNNYEGFFDMWLPISEGLNIKTKFLQPTIYNTLGIPATVRPVISVGSYNPLTNTISSFSGRGKPYVGEEIKPDIVAPGENIYSTAPNRSFTVKSGTSMATPHVTGICALMMQWGIVNRNDPYLYGERLRYYLIIGSKRRRVDIQYPNPSWGFGEVCAYDSLNIVNQTISSLVRKRELNYMFREKQFNNMIRQLDQVGNIDAGIDVNYDISSSENVFLLVELTGEAGLEEVLKIPDVEGVMISENFAILITPANKIEDIRDVVVNIVNIEVSTVLTLNATSPIEASGAITFNNNPYLRLTGTDVVVGVIDTGIDYLNTEFRREDDTTRILRIWDQTIQGDKDIYQLKYGTEYTEEQINSAIQLQISGGDPYSIVPSRDEIGHGTNVSSIIGGRGINPDLKGAAPNCDFIVVKLARATEVELKAALIDNATMPSYTPWSVLLGLRYIVRAARELKRPVVVYIPLGSTMGSHTGNGVVETSITNFSGQTATVVVVPTGNQGDTDTHTEGLIENSGDIKDIEIRVGEMQKNLPIEIWVNRPNRVKLSIISPSGEIIDDLESKNTNNRRIKFLYEGTEMIVNFTDPEISTGDSFIFIRAYNLRPGIWKFRLTGNYIVNGRYYSWIPQRELLDADTKFLNPVGYTTLTLPSTSRGAISVAYYNQDNNAVLSSSGKGYTRDQLIKPDIAAGGVNAVVTQPGGGTSIISGASVAGAVVAGCCALILQWAVTDGNAPDIYATQIKSYIISGARVRPGDVYPNRDWGYGMFDLQGVFDRIMESYTPRGSGEDNYREYNVGKLFIRVPNEI